MRQLGIIGFGYPIYFMIDIRSGRPWSAVQRLSAQDEGAILMVFSGSHPTILKGSTSLLLVGFLFVKHTGLLGYQPQLPSIAIIV